VAINSTLAKLGRILLEIFIFLLGREHCTLYSRSGLALLQWNLLRLKPTDNATSLWG